MSNILKQQFESNLLSELTSIIEKQSRIAKYKTDNVRIAKHTNVNGKRANQTFTTNQETNTHEKSMNLSTTLFCEPVWLLFVSVFFCYCVPLFSIVFCFESSNQSRTMNNIRTEWFAKYEYKSLLYLSFVCWWIFTLLNSMCWFVINTMAHNLDKSHLTW